MIKNTIFKKVKSLHSKSNSKYYKNNDPNNKTQLRKDISNQIFKNINDLCINENPNNFLTITIEKDYPENYNLERKQNSLNNNLNLSNKFQVKTKYIFIDKDKNLSPKTNLENKLQKLGDSPRAETFQAQLNKVNELIDHLEKEKEELSE